MNSDAVYKDAFVDVSKDATTGKYEYAVTMKSTGDKVYFTADKTLNKDALKNK